MPSSGGSISSYVGSKWATILVVAAIGAAAIAVPAVTGGGSTTITCDQTAANSSALASAITAASSGTPSTICLTAATSYGSFTGTSKPVTIVAQNGTGARNPVSASMTLSLGSGDTGFTIDGNMTSWDCACGMTINSGTFTSGSSSAHDITLKNFRGSGTGGSRYFNFDPTTAGANITIDHAYLHDYIGGEATIFVWASATTDTGIVIKNTLFKHSSTDGVKLSNPVKVSLLNNKFVEFHESYSGDGNHTDAIQFNSGNFSIVRGNVVIDADQCISGFDGQAGLTITHNVVADCDAHAFTLMKDNSASTLAWNTVGPGGENNIICGNKSGLTGASVTNIYNNITSGVVLSGGGTTCTPTRNDHNTGTITQTYVGGSSASITASWSFGDFCVASGAALTGADDGGQQGVCGGDYDPETDGPPAGEDP